MALVFALLSICWGETFTLTVDGKLVQFSAVERLSCKTTACEARSAVARAKSIVLTKRERSNGRNPGTMKCRKIGGTVLIATDVRRDEVSVCLFADGSLVESASLR